LLLLNLRYRTKFLLRVRTVQTELSWSGTNFMKQFRPKFTDNFVGNDLKYVILKIIVPNIVLHLLFLCRNTSKIWGWKFIQKKFSVEMELCKIDPWLSASMTDAPNLRLRMKWSDAMSTELMVWNRFDPSVSAVIYGRILNNFFRLLGIKKRIAFSLSQYEQHC
jgi:hypothetical protein